MKETKPTRSDGYPYDENSISHGSATLASHMKREAWVAPGGRLIFDRVKAEACAKRMNELMVGV